MVKGILVTSYPFGRPCKRDPCNIMGEVADRDQNDLYCIAVHAGLLKGRNSRNQFDVCNQQLYTLSDMRTDIEVGLRHAAKDESLGGGQGYANFNCAISM